MFELPLSVLGTLPQRRWADHALRVLTECANHVADSLSALGYDHSGPLYHRILPNAKAYGAFYTNNLSALMLARLALGPDFCDWNDLDAVSRLRIMDPACGTGTLLMAALHTIKARVAEAGEDVGDAVEGGSGRAQTDGGSASADSADSARLHGTLVEKVLYGLDVNRTAIQLAACDLTLGAATVDYKRMNLLTLKHGPQRDGSVRAGSLDILVATDRRGSLHTLIRPLRTLGGLAAQQVDSAEDAEFPLKDLDLVMMNPPFTNNKQWNRQFGPAVVRRMQEHELRLHDEVEAMDPDIRGVIDINSVGTYFSPLAGRLLDRSAGVVAKVMPVRIWMDPGVNHR